MTANDNNNIEMNTSVPPAPQSAVGEERSGAPAPSETQSELERTEAPKVRWYKRKFFRKLSYALLALIIAVTVWGYVLMSENPVRVKSIENVRLSIDGGSEASFQLRNLIITEDLSSLLPTVTVNVQTRLDQLPRFDTALGDVVTASINLNDIRSPGVYEKQITATSTIGTPISIEPSTVTITVENYVRRDVPITYSFANELPEGYWHSKPELRIDTLTLEGAESKISRIVKANCVIDLSGITESIHESFEPELLDDEYNVLDKTGVVGTVPSVILSMSVLPYTDISLEDYVSLSGGMSDNYEISSVSINPPTLSVAAPRDVLNSIENTLYIEQINASNLYPGTHQQRVSVMGLTNDMKLLSDNSFIVTIEVVDKVVQRTVNVSLDDVLIEGENLEMFNYQYGTHSFSVQLVGPARIVNALKDSDISLYLDVSRLTRGTHEITPTLSVENEPSWLYDGSVAITVQRSYCTITLAAPEP